MDIILMMVFFVTKLEKKSLEMLAGTRFAFLCDIKMEYMAGWIQFLFMIGRSQYYPHQTEIVLMLP